MRQILVVRGSFSPFVSRSRGTVACSFATTIEGSGEVHDSVAISAISGLTAAAVSTLPAVFGGWVSYRGVAHKVACQVARGVHLTARRVAGCQRVLPGSCAREQTVLVLIL